jgi:hypothetical protein
MGLSVPTVRAYGAVPLPHKKDAGVGLPSIQSAAGSIPVLQGLYLLPGGASFPLDRRGVMLSMPLSNATYSAKRYPDATTFWNATTFS